MQWIQTLVLIVTASVGLSGCGSPPAPRDPVGETFPTVQATGLDGDSLTLPADLSGTPTVLLVGYVMEAQFDCDRWILGLLQSGAPVEILEVPTISGMVPGMFAGFIDEGMRGGIPREDWGTVATVYDDADRIVQLTGDDGSRNARVLLLDGDGTVRWFHDRGYSASSLLSLMDALQPSE